VSKNNLYLISFNIFRALVATLETQIAGLRVDIAELRGDISGVQHYRNIQMLLIKKNLSRRAGGSLMAPLHRLISSNQVFPQRRRRITKKVLPSIDSNRHLPVGQIFSSLYFASCLPCLQFCYPQPFSTSSQACSETTSLLVKKSN
jgi:hypothetical protein